jgi:hypothetical protein
MEVDMKRISILLLVFCTCFTLAAWPQARPQWQHKIITFDVSGAGTGAGQGTVGIGVNQWGFIVGYYTDANGVSHGFLRNPDGAVAKFDPTGSMSTYVYGLNMEGATTGFYVDANNVYHGFLRNLKGKMTTFDAPGAGTAAGQGTITGDINDFGVIAGYYYDPSNVGHGFLRAPNGKITTFDAVGAGTGPGQGTFPQFFSALTDFGAATGFYVDANNVYHGFVLNPDGTITDFDAPGVGTGAYQGTLPYSINLGGTAIGLYIDTSTVGHGFVRSRDGTIATVDVPGAGTGPGTGVGFGFVQGTIPLGNNLGGETIGIYVDQNNASHGFLLTPNGEITKFDVHGAGTGANQGTFACTNNMEGAIAGFYIDASNVSHGFLRMP